jgi:hypothetical protein
MDDIITAVKNQVRRMAEELNAETWSGDRRARNKYLFSSNYMSDIHPCSATDDNSGSD